jgi:hypothetical protein
LAARGFGKKLKLCLNDALHRRLEEGRKSRGEKMVSDPIFISQGRISGISTIPTAGAGGGSTAIQNASFTFDAIGSGSIQGIRRRGGSSRRPRYAALENAIVGA